MIKPARSNRDIALRRHPIRARTIATIQTSLISSTRNEVLCIERGPTRFAADSTLVANPANIGAGIAKQAGIWLQLANHLPGRRPVIVCLAINPPHLFRSAVKPIAAIGSVEKHFKDRSIVGQQFAQLIAEVSQILRPAIVRMISIPRREIDTELDAVFSTRLRDFSNYIAAPI